MNRGTYKIRRNRATDLLFMYLVLKKGLSELNIQKK